MGNKTRITRLAAFLLSAVLCFSLSIPALAAKNETETVREEPEYRLTLTLRTAEDLLALASDCSLDSWSRDVLVVLAGDISLAGLDFLPIPSFGGTLEGGGHVISGLEMTGSHAPAGLFARVQESAVIRDLRLEGGILPGGDGALAGGVAGINSGRIENCSFTGTVSASSRVGGIAGRNTMSGVISGCSVSGGVFGLEMTGGIAGENLGLVEDCRNDSYVNIRSVDPTLPLDSLDISNFRDLLFLASPDTFSITSDTGGIAGFSSGTISGCRNHGIVGYQHLGYNVGGIVGRSCGYVNGCSNDGAVYGRKEVGGVVGQAEPYIESSVTEDLLQTLSGEMGGLNALINNAIKDTDDTMGDLASAFIGMAGIIKPIRDALDSVSDFSDLEALRTLMDRVSASLGSLQSQINAVTGSMRDVSETLSNDFRRINNQISAISGTTIDAMSAISGAALTDIVTDASQVDIDAVTLGKVLDCTNAGPVCGDVNVGGVAGSMAIDNALDPEDDLSIGVASTVRTEYKLKAILQQCASSGAVLAKKDGAGCVCGRMDLGLIYRCQGAGSAESADGDYVGGVCGRAYGTIRSSWAKCTLRGGSYVGGIIGCGDRDPVTGISSEVADCLSMVEIPRSIQYAGAVAGSETGAFSGNWFVSDTLSGINTLSYQGMAEPVSYAELLEREDLPGLFRSFTLTFAADGKTLKTVGFEYGSSFDGSVYPPIPEKDGFYGVWDRSELRDLHFDTVVSVDYRPRITALAAEAFRDGDRPVFYVEGQFRSGDAVAVSFQDPEELSVEDFRPSWQELIRTQLSAVFHGEKPDSSIAAFAADLWSLEIPDDGLKTHTVRYRPPGGTDDIHLYLDDGNGWRLAPARAVGSYLLFETGSLRLRGAAVSTIRTVWLALGALVAALLAAALVVVILRLRKRRPSRPKKDRPVRGSLRVPLSPAQKKKWRRIVLAMLAVLILGGGAAAAILRTTGVHREWEIYSQLRQLLSRDEVDMDARVMLQSPDGRTELEMPVCRIRADKTFVTRLELEGISVYCSDGILYLDNGKAFVRAGTAAPEAALNAVLQAFRSAPVTCSQEGDRNEFRIQLAAEDAGALLAMFFPLQDIPLPEGSPVTLRLVQEAGTIAAMDVSFAGGGYNALCQLTFSPASRGHELPQAVREAVLSGAAPPERILSGDVIRLLSAWKELEGRRMLKADVRLFADCGAVLLDEELEYLRADVQGTVIRGVRSGPAGVYFTAETACTADGAVLADRKGILPDAASVWELAGELIRNGDLACRTTGGRSVYTLTLDDARMRSVMEAAAPQTSELNVSFSSGTLRVVVDDGRIADMEFNCLGSVRVVLVDVDAVVSARIIPRENAMVRIPPAVRSVLAADPKDPA